MVILIDGKPIKEVKGPLQSYLINEPFIRNASENFMRNLKKFETSHDLLYIHQASYAVVCRNESCPQYIGSDDATSCLIITAYTDQKAIICHLDFEDRISELLKVYTDNFSTDEVINLVVSGGFRNYDGLSEKLIQVLHSASLKISLKLFHVSHLNTDEKTGKPISLGLVFNTRTNAFYAAHFTLKARDPISTYRNGLFFANSRSLATYFDTENNRLCLPLYELPIIPRVTRENIANFSTTPYCEPDTFYSEHEKLEVMSRRMNCFPREGRKRIKFHLNEEKIWIASDDFSRDIETKIKEICDI